MSKPPKLSLAAIVASATPPERGGAEIVSLNRVKAEAGRSETPATALPLKQRARQMSVYLEPPVYDQLRDLAHAERAKMHGLMLEALDLLFKQRGARSIDQLVKSPPR
jgi:hypothetical protein